MIKKTFLFLTLVIFLSGCVGDSIEPQTNKNISEPNEIIISYEEYKKLYENKDKTTQKDKETISSEPIITPEEYKKLIDEGKEATNSQATEDEMVDAFMDFYHEWKNVKYKFGGNSKKGIDCSAFTQRVYKEKFDVSIPRSTRTQVRTGIEVKKSDLEIGDLVFFKTGRIDRHVGIYMGDGNFMHASIKGIKFTKLDKPFYKKAYWTSRRIIN